jgi:hypothetical protein
LVTHNWTKNNFKPVKTAAAPMLFSDLQGCKKLVEIGRTAWQGYQARLPSKAAGTRLPGKDAGTRLPGKAAGQGCRAMLPCKAAECM